MSNAVFLFHILSHFYNILIHFHFLTTSFTFTVAFSHCCFSVRLFPRIIMKWTLFFYSDHHYFSFVARTHSIWYDNFLKSSAILLFNSCSFCSFAALNSVQSDDPFHFCIERFRILCFLHSFSVCFFSDSFYVNLSLPLSIGRHLTDSHLLYITLMKSI